MLTSIFLYLLYPHLGPRALVEPIPEFILSDQRFLITRMFLVTFETFTQDKSNNGSRDVWWSPFKVVCDQGQSRTEQNKDISASRQI